MKPFAHRAFAAALSLLLAACATVQPTETVGPNDPAALAAIGANGLPLKVESEGTGRMLGFSS